MQIKSSEKRAPTFKGSDSDFPKILVGYLTYWKVVAAAD